ncbi:MAG: hypothetical protein ACTSRG_25365 [Candidatus Helarchaeota archaeon]
MEKARVEKMFIIINKGKRWVQMQLEDYFGKIKVKFFDLHNKRGRDQFTKTFARDTRTAIMGRRKWASKHH